MNIPRALATCILSAFALGSCKVDNRTLQAAGGSSGTANNATGGRPSNGGSRNEEGGAPGDAGTGAVSAAATTSDAGEPAVGGAGGAADPGPLGPPLVDGCVDLDENGVGDCSETLVKNGNFKLDAQDWAPDFRAMLDWSESNAYGDAPSGAGLVASTGVLDVDGLLLAAATQCVAVTTGMKLKIMANVFIEPGQSEGLAGVGIFFFDQASCMGTIKDSFDASGAATGAWSTLRGERTVVEGVASMLVRLTTSKAYRSESFQAKFDNILVSSQ